MNCVLHFIYNTDDIKNVEHNYKTLSSVVDKHFLITFNPEILPQNCNFEQIFSQKFNFIDEWHLDYHLYHLKYFVTKYLLLKRYKRVMFISSNLKLENVEKIPELYNSIRADNIDCIKFSNKDIISKDIYMMRIQYMKTNLIYSDCSYEQYCTRNKIYGHDLYISSPFYKIENLEYYNNV